MDGIVSLLGILYNKVETISQCAVFHLRFHQGGGGITFVIALAIGMRHIYPAHLVARLSAGHYFVAM